MVPKATLHAKKKKEVIEKPIAKTKKMKKKNYQSFSIYIFKLLRSVIKENFGISRHSMLIMNNFVNDMLEKIASEAGRLASHSKKTTLGSREIQSAIKLLIPGELAKHADIEAMKAITMYHNSQERDSKSH
ncbi:late histone H2B.L4-like [Vanessa atalanta]|uniref:late histone H2B.L4-like n=1 Tax=Vanessa atalanta TaxID=42275 RepID=UPI001FCE2CAC|nr:late histone H2B.L4-like [Vanessa atalanta]